MSNINDFFNKGRQYEHSPMMHVQEQKPYASIASVVGYNDRDLNSLLTNEISGASLSSGSVVLPAGEYYVDGVARAENNVSLSSFNSVFVNGIEVLTGIGGGSYSDETYNIVSGKIVLAVPSTVSLKTNSDVAYASSLGSLPSNNDRPYMVPAELKIWKLDAIKTSPILYDNKLYPLPGNAYVTGNMYGLDYRKTGDNTISVDAGICMDSLNTTILTGSALQTVTIGSTINEIYNLFLCDDGIVRTDTNVDGATLLAGSVSKLRWIGFVGTDASGKVRIGTKCIGDLLIMGAEGAIPLVTNPSTTPFIPTYTGIIPIERVKRVGLWGKYIGSGFIFGRFTESGEQVGRIEINYGTYTAPYSANALLLALDDYLAALLSSATGIVIIKECYLRR